MSDAQDWYRRRFGETELVGCMGAAFPLTLAILIVGIALYGGFQLAREVRPQESYAGVGVVATTQTPPPTASPTPAPTPEVVVIEETPAPTARYTTPSPTQAPSDDCTTTYTDGGVVIRCGDGGVTTTPRETPHETAPGYTPGH